MLTKAKCVRADSGMGARKMLMSAKMSGLTLRQDAEGDNPGAPLAFQLIQQEVTG